MSSFPILSSRPRRGRLLQMLGQMAPWVILLLGLGGTGWAWRVAMQQERTFQVGRLEGAVAQTREAVEHRIEEQSKLLLVAQGLVAGRPRISPEEWRHFVASLEPRRLSPGTRLMGYVPQEVPTGSKAGVPLLEPESEAAQLGPHGAQLLKLPGFLEAASRARVEGSLAVSGRLILPGSGISCIALVLPVFRDLTTPDQPPNRPSPIQGLVICLVDGHELFKPMYGSSPIADLDVEIFDGPVGSEEALIYDRDLCQSNNHLSMAMRPGARIMPLQVGGRHWNLVVGFVSPGGGAREGRLQVVALGGAIVSLLAFALTLYLSYSRSKLEDLTDQLMESEARFRSVAETASCAIFIYSDQVEYMNEAGARITGYGIDEIVGEPLIKLVHPYDHDLVQARAQARLRGDSVPLRYEFRLKTKQGETRWIDFAAGTVTLGNRRFGLGTAFDVTERVKANEGRLKLERKLLEAQKLESLGLLAGGVAHDFNNLLTVIQGNAGMMRDAMDEPEVTQGCLRNIEETCRRASDLVRQMLAYSGRGRVQVHLLDLNRLIQEIAQLLSVSIPKTIAIRYELEESLPPVSGDAAQLQQVIMNLVTNAAEAIGDAEGAVTLRSGRCELGETDVTGLRVAEALSPGTFVYFEVVDTGSGMDGATQARIFDPFFSTKFTGRGLGLAAMQGIVRGHGGGVQIQSSPGAGTLFRIYLPAQSGTIQPEEDLVADPSTPVVGTGLVLVADDEPGIRELVRKVLLKTGFEVIVAADGLEAVEHVRAHQQELRLVMVDLTMPKLGGDEALAEMRALGFSGPVIRWSGFARTDTTPDARASFLRKPFTAEDLLALVRKALG